MAKILKPLCKTMKSIPESFVHRKHCLVKMKTIFNLNYKNTSSNLSMKIGKQQDQLSASSRKVLYLVTFCNIPTPDNRKFIKVILHKNL